MNNQGDDEGGIPAELSEEEPEQTTYDESPTDSLLVEDLPVNGDADETKKEALQNEIPNQESIQQPSSEQSLDKEVILEEEISISEHPGDDFDLMEVFSDPYIPLTLPQSNLGLAELGNEGARIEFRVSEELSDYESAIQGVSLDVSDLSDMPGKDEANGTATPYLIRKELDKLKGTMSQFDAIESLYKSNLIKETLHGLQEFMSDELTDEEGYSKGEMIMSEEGISEDHLSEAELIPEPPSGDFAVDLLEADNPMMLKFQQMLKKHLVRQKERLLQQLNELDMDQRKTNDEFKNIGENIANEVRISKQQQEVLNNFKKSIQMVNDERNKLGMILENQHKEFKTLKNDLTEKKTAMNKLDQEKEMHAQLLKKIEEYQKYQDEQLILSKMQNSRNKADLKQILEDKQKQDLILWRITQIILQMEHDRDDAEKRILAIKEAVFQLENKVTAGEVDLEGLNLEVSLIRQSINKSFQIVNTKNQAFATSKMKMQQAKDNYTELIYKVKIVQGDCESLNKLEEETRFKKRKTTETCMTMKSQLSTTIENVNQMEEYRAKLDPVLDYNEKRLRNVIKEGKHLEREYEKCMKQFNNELLRQKELKKMLLDKIVESNSTDSVKIRINKQIKKLEVVAKEQELALAEAENKLAKIIFDKEMLISALLDTEKKLHCANKATEEKIDQYKGLEKQIKDKKGSLQIYKTKISVMRNKIDQMKQKGEEKQMYLNPYEVRIRNLEDELKKLQIEHENLENSWLKLQNEVLHKGDQRNNLIAAVFDLRKEYTAIEQFRRRGEGKIYEMQFKKKKCNKELNYAHKQLEKIEFETFESGKLRDQLEKSAFLHEKNYEQELMVAENESVDIQKQIMELEEINEEMANRVKKFQKELLHWEKKLKSALVEKEKIHRETESSGEIGAMKIEIHRMEVRLSQLKKAETKMMYDLENCVSRRESIIDAAEAREMRFKSGGKHVTRVQIERKISEMKTKIKLARQSMQNLQRDMEAAIDRDNQLKEEEATLNDQVEQLKDAMKRIEMQIHEGQIHKHSCLEITVLRQRKARMLEDLKFNRYRCMNRNEAGVIIEEEKQTSIHNALEEVLDALKVDFPHLGLQIIQIYNSLKPPEK